MIQRFDRFFIRTLVALILVAGSGCTGAWQKALHEDTSAAYYRYMRDHPDSDHHAQAQERLDFLKLKRDLNLRTYQAFLQKYPDTLLVEEIRSRLEPHALAAARSAGTADAYRAFIAGFPDGELVERARGNLAYIDAKGFGGRAQELTKFADKHPESDFAAEARRSAEASRLRDRSRFERIALSVEIAPNVPDARRWRTKFQQRTKKIYAEAGREIIVIPAIVDPQTARSLPPARLTIQHTERSQRASIEDGTVSRPGMLAETIVTLQAGPDRPPIFRRVFTLRIDSTQHAEGSSVLASTASPRYWNDFFVPVSTWQTSAVVRPPIKLKGEVVDIDAAGDRVAVLYENGHFQLIELADPEAPLVLAEYERPNDMKKWSGVTILGNRVAVFGEEGIEMVAFGKEGPYVELSYDRSQIGTVFALEPYGQYLAAAGARGLMLIDLERGVVKHVMRRVIKSLAVVGDDLVFTDGESLFVSNIKLLRQKRVSAQMKLGRAFGLWRIRSFAPRAVAIGHAGALVLDLSQGDKPVVTARLDNKEAGRVTDAAAVRGRIFLLGDRGLQMMDARATRLVESIDVLPQTRVATMGRHVVAVGDEHLQVVDAAPLTPWPMPAEAAGR
ncbi:MAG: hypothetical protein JRH17_00330 [Deltaproteobacteria bacterium]|nr:hypothetical protein [Deltaproteobacteria bacterium]